MSTTPEALKLADDLDALVTSFGMPGRMNTELQAAAELRRLAQVEQYAETLNARCIEDAAEIGRLRAEVEALRGLKPVMPPRPPHHNDASFQHPSLPRYGLRWNGPGQPVSVPMADGYWTPFHLALEALRG